jgi:monovalent cation:H+ antiporter, CPA1 family
MNLFRICALLLTIALLLVEHLTGGLGARLAGITLDPAVRRQLLDVLLAIFLFAGALHVRNDGTILPNIRLVMLSTLSLGLSTVIVAYLVWWLFGKLEIELAWTWCLLFGALISPVDPLSTSRLLRLAGAETELTGKVAAEAAWSSIFGVVLFLALLMILTGEAGRAAPLSGLLVQQAIGAALLGLSVGILMIFLLKKLTRAEIQAALTLAMIVGILAIAVVMGLSGPVAAGTAGVVIAMGRGQWALAEEGRGRLTRFWSLLAEGVIAILLVWLGLALMLEPMTLKHVTIGILLVPVVLVTRMASVGVPVRISVLRKQFTPEVVRIIAWGGVRSALALALVLSLPPGRETRLLMIMTFMILAFSILMQGPLYTLKARAERPLAPEKLGAGSEKGSDPL